MTVSCKGETSDCLPVGWTNQLRVVHVNIMPCNVPGKYMGKAVHTVEVLQQCLHCLHQRARANTTAASAKAAAATVLLLRSDVLGRSPSDALLSRPCSRETCTLQVALIGVA